MKVKNMVQKHFYTTMLRESRGRNIIIKKEGRAQNKP
jgi:hypothetical protein